MAQIAFLPSLGASGVWSLAAPYSDLVVAGAIYRCDSTTLLSSAVVNGDDPLNNIYLAAGDSEDRYNADLANEDYLITISSTVGARVTFPRSALQSLPKSDGVVYQTVVASISLSAIPEKYDLTALEAALKAAVLEKVGVKSSVYFQATGEKLLMSYEQDALLAQVREALAEDPTSIYTQFRELTAAHTAQTLRLQMLEAYVAKHFVDITPPNGG